MSSISLSFKLLLLALIGSSFCLAGTTPASTLLAYKYDAENYDGTLPNIASHATYNFPAATINTQLVTPKGLTYDRFGLTCKCFNEATQTSSECPETSACLRVKGSSQTDMEFIYKAFTDRVGQRLMINVAVTFPKSSTSGPIGILAIGRTSTSVMEPIDNANNNAVNILVMCRSPLPTMILCTDYTTMVSVAYNSPQSLRNNKPFVMSLLMEPAVGNGPRRMSVLINGVIVKTADRFGVLPTDNILPVDSSSAISFGYFSSLTDLRNPMVIHSASVDSIQTSVADIDFLLNQYIASRPPAAFQTNVAIAVTNPAWPSIAFETVSEPESSYFLPIAFTIPGDISYATWSSCLKLVWISASMVARELTQSDFSSLVFSRTDSIRFELISYEKPCLRSFDIAYVVKTTSSEHAVLTSTSHYRITVDQGFGKPSVYPRADAHVVNPSGDTHIYLNAEYATRADPLIPLKGTTITALTNTSCTFYQWNVKTGKVGTKITTLPADIPDGNPIVVRPSYPLCGNDVSSPCPMDYAKYDTAVTTIEYVVKNLVNTPSQSVSESLTTDLRLEVPTLSLLQVSTDEVTDISLPTYFNPMVKESLLRSLYPEAATTDGLSLELECIITQLPSQGRFVAKGSDILPASLPFLVPGCLVQYKTAFDEASSLNRISYWYRVKGLVVASKTTLTQEIQALRRVSELALTLIVPQDEKGKELSMKNGYPIELSKDVTVDKVVSLTDPDLGLSYHAPIYTITISLTKESWLMFTCLPQTGVECSQTSSALVTVKCVLKDPNHCLAALTISTSAMETANLVVSVIKSDSLAWPGFTPKLSETIKIGVQSHQQIYGGGSAFDVIMNMLPLFLAIVIGLPLMTAALIVFLCLRKRAKNKLKVALELQAQAEAEAVSKTEAQAQADSISIALAEEQEEKQFAQITAGVVAIPVTASPSLFASHSQQLNSSMNNGDSFASAKRNLIHEINAGEDVAIDIGSTTNDVRSGSPAFNSQFEYSYDSHAPSSDAAQYEYFIQQQYQMQQMQLQMQLQMSHSISSPQPDLEAFDRKMPGTPEQDRTPFHQDIMGKVHAQDGMDSSPLSGPSQALQALQSLSPRDFLGTRASGEDSDSDDEASQFYLQAQAKMASNQAQVQAQAQGCASSFSSDLSQSGRSSSNLPGAYAPSESAASFATSIQSADSANSVNSADNLSSWTCSARSTSSLRNHPEEEQVVSSEREHNYAVAQMYQQQQQVKADYTPNFSRESEERKEHAQPQSMPSYHSSLSPLASPKFYAIPPNFSAYQQQIHQNTSLPSQNVQLMQQNQMLQYQLMQQAQLNGRSSFGVSNSPASSIPMPMHMASLAVRTDHLDSPQSQATPSYAYNRAGLELSSFSSPMMSPMGTFKGTRGHSAASSSFSQGSHTPISPMDRLHNTAANSSFSPMSSHKKAPSTPGTPGMSSLKQSSQGVLTPGQKNISGKTIGTKDLPDFNKLSMKANQLSEACDVNNRQMALLNYYSQNSANSTPNSAMTNPSASFSSMNMSSMSMSSINLGNPSHNNTLNRKM